MCILQESHQCRDFKRYIGDGFKQDLMNSEKDITEKDASATKELAFHYLVYWLDSSDYALFLAGSFRNYRAEQICEKYLDHGAKLTVSQALLLRLCVYMSIVNLAIAKRQRGWAHVVAFFILFSLTATIQSIDGR